MTPVNACTLFSTQAVPFLSNLRKSVLRCCQSLLPSSSHSSSALAFPESTVSNSSDGLNGTANNTNKSESAEHDDLLLSEVTDFGWKVREEPHPEVTLKLSLWEKNLQPGSARTEQKPIAERHSSFVEEEKTADDGRKAGRRHLGFDASPTNDAGYLFPPLPMSDQRRYSLVDLGLVNAPTAGRRTLSDVGACTTSLRPHPGLPSNINNASEELESGPEFRLSSPPSTARFSTFAEMGIQSFAMSKGEKTVDSKKKDTKPYDKRRHKKTDGAVNVAVVSKERKRRFLEPTNPIHAQEKNVVVLESPEIEPDAIVTPAETHHKPKKHRSPKLKSTNCIVM
ncbi:hypothetical protein ACEPAI_5549 [Sanghuangporus weigelae]